METTETSMFQLVFPTDTNHLGNLFGGTLVSWMDKAAAYTAIRRAKSTVVTAHIDSIDFKVPIKKADIVEVTARVEGVGRTSMQVRVDVYRENPLESNPRELATVGHFKMVALDSDGRPKPIPSE